MAEMDRMGLAECRGKRDELAQRMRDNLDNWTWSRQFASWAMGAWSFATHPELWDVVDPRDPFPGLIEVACRRVESESTIAS